MITPGNDGRGGLITALLAAAWVMMAVPAAWCSQAAAPTATPAAGPVLLYFADSDGRGLKPERFTLPHRGDTLTDGRALVAALIDGPSNPSLTPVLPADGAVKGFYVTENQTAVVDLDTTLQDRSPGGIMSEMLSVFAVVNTLVLNLPDIDRVILLFNGQPADTFAGHIDLESPLKANLLLIR